EIVEPERIVCSDSFADEKGNPVPASHYGMPGEWPSETQWTITFEVRGVKTWINLNLVGIPAGQMSELAQAGWNESLDKLAASLK
ncbi:MAG TPA: SRPBCC domain-containing protein, partial [bacterium]